MRTNLKTILKSLLTLTLFSVSISAFAVWTPPSTAPTGNNTPSPINIGALLQEKVGALYAGGLATPVFQMTTAPVANYVLKSDASGFGSWVDVNTLVTGGGGGGTGMANPMTTLGDMIYGQTGGVPTRLPIGPTAGQILTVVNGIPAWQSPGNPSAGGWTDDGPVVRLTTSTDKVGIGTSSPTEQLEITKNFMFPDTNADGTAGVIKFGANRFIHKAGQWNTFIGENAGNFSLTGDSNTGAGADALKSNTSGDDNSAFGYKALTSNTSGNDNTAVGKSALENNTSGSSNSAVGVNALSSNSGGNNNSAFGMNALSANTSGSENTALGKDALNSNTTGTKNIAIGYQADVSGGGLTNATVIGANATVNASNTMVFGNGSVVGWGFGTQPGSYAIKVGTGPSNGNGARLTLAGEWQQGSDRSKKHDIQDISYGLEDILALRPVSFKWNETNEDAIGFIAQEVEKIIPEIVSGEEGDMAISYAQITPALVKAVQELKEENDMLRERILKLKERLEK